MELDNKPQILVVDDDKRLRELLFRYLNKQDCLVICAEDAKMAEGYLERFAFDLAILDVMMPGETGIDFIRRIKPSYPQLPFLMLTALGETESRISGLEAGVDDYLAKPFEPKELWLRIQAILRRTIATVPTRESKIGAFEYNPENRILTSDTGQDIALTESENTLLEILFHSANETVDRYDLAEQMGLDASERSIDVQITRLRKKIETDPKSPRHLQTVRGKGYMLRI